MSLTSIQTKPSLAWKLFGLLLFVIVLNLILKLAGINTEENTWMRFPLLALPIILLFLHSSQTLSFKRGMFFIALAAITGLVAEVWGLRSGTFFGGHYIYRPEQMMIYSVPLSVIFFWAVFVYTGYNIVNSFLVWLEKDKPNWTQHNIFLLPLLIFLDGWIVVTMDLLLDPIQTKFGAWTWIDGGYFFGVPIGNFTGWFIVAIFVTGLFRSFEYFFPYEHEYDKSLLLVSVLGYGALGLSLAIIALKLHMSMLAVIGSILILPIVTMNLFLYKRFLIGQRNI